VPPAIANSCSVLRCPLSVTCLSTPHPSPTLLHPHFLASRSPLLCSALLSSALLCSVVLWPPIHLASPRRAVPQLCSSWLSALCTISALCCELSALPARPCSARLCSALRSLLLSSALCGFALLCSALLCSRCPSLRPALLCTDFFLHTPNRGWQGRVTAKKSRAEQSRAEHEQSNSRAEQGRVEHGLSRGEERRAEERRAEQSRAEQSTTVRSSRAEKSRGAQRKGLLLEPCMGFSHMR
jgi:hypothetical protein